MHIMRREKRDSYLIQIHKNRHKLTNCNMYNTCYLSVHSNLDIANKSVIPFFFTISNLICLVNAQNGIWALFTISRNSLYQGSLYQGLNVHIKKISNSTTSSSCQWKWRLLVNVHGSSREGQVTWSKKKFTTCLKFQQKSCHNFSLCNSYSQRKTLVEILYAIWQIC